MTSCFCIDTLKDNRPLSPNRLSSCFQWTVLIKMTNTELGTFLHITEYLYVNLVAIPHFTSGYDFSILV